MAEVEESLFHSMLINYQICFTEVIENLGNIYMGKPHKIISCTASNMNNHAKAILIP